MTSGTAAATGFALAGGIAGGVQVAVAGAFGRRIGVLEATAFGAVVVTSISYAPSRIGAFATIALLISGQLAAGVLIDSLGLFGSERIPVSAARLAGLALLAGGAALVLRR